MDWANTLETGETNKGQANTLGTGKTNKGQAKQIRDRVNKQVQVQAIGEAR